MNAIVDQLVSAFFIFLRSAIGIALRPYETYRSIIRRQNVWELFYIAAIMIMYFAGASLIKTAALRPFLLTARFTTLAAGATATYILAVSFLWYTTTRVGGNGSLRALAIGWAYTLLPTVIWFLMTSVLYVAVPPPRTTRFLGLLFSGIYLVFSTVLLYWKVILGYLTLRFAMRLDLGKILLIATVSSPVFAVYSYIMYKLGIFRIPFI
ncbi:hypothetical protein A2154_02245 [Candidatus Gottesmanbacteria bacterium RBG_16_43_7]|uniref:Yip1 domain-containing protein n=1 Tax=Candidatus Gottesmanbacteria bacterium RBG_16_43_7 TaxID=1798373 RepID=A0A1F5ZAK9_9BACT|nr:MAG: hypothetical protein A2154_02245 [Candidatus Gottesmanbacteria bacterium RBG_16_43_7]